MLIVKTTKALPLLLCLAVLTSGCSSISRLQEFPEPPQVFGGTRLIIAQGGPSNSLAVGFGGGGSAHGHDNTVFAGNFGGGGLAHGQDFKLYSSFHNPFGGSGGDAGLLLLVPMVAIVLTDIPFSLAVDVAALPITIPAELWWYSQTEREKSAKSGSEEWLLEKEIEEIEEELQGLEPEDKKKLMEELKALQQERELQRLYRKREEALEAGNEEAAKKYFEQAERLRQDLQTQRRKEDENLDRESGELKRLDEFDAAPGDD